jgi:4-hydroxythreonine-4-phosphate dehydrogenase
MIYITCGHEKSIGLEIFLKSFMLLSQKERAHLHLITDPTVLEQNLKVLDLPYEFKDDHVKISENPLFSTFFDTHNGPSCSTQALTLALNMIEQKNDILVTLPTSKDQLNIHGVQLKGYTEFLRSWYKKNSLSMSFYAPDEKILLITDHLALKDVAQSLSFELIVSKTQHTLKGYERYFGPIQEVIFAGLNPHAGENGLLGDEEIVIKKAIKYLKERFCKIQFQGPFSGDILHTYKKNTTSQLFVYMYHDQGLTSFKARNKMTGINLTFGLPFLRMSVDHGTAFDLYGKNQANYLGKMFLLHEALKIHRKLRRS